jgi:hypothetical protein
MGQKEGRERKRGQKVLLDVHSDCVAEVQRFGI